jgi:Ca2+-binding RTX toxin-like protein
VLSEQKAFELYMEARHGTPETAFKATETAAALDTRIQSTALRNEAVLSSGDVISADPASINGSRLRGGSGDDLFMLANANDRASGGKGLDTVIAMFGVDLGDKRFSQIENATLLGVSDLALNGNGGGNRLVGNLGDNRLDGGRGNDTLTGGAGSDLFVLRKGSIDTVTDLARGEDRLVVLARDFKSLDVFGLSSTDFDTFFRYDAGSGALSVDQNGAKAGGLLQIAIIGNRPVDLDASDILVL